MTKGKKKENNIKIIIIVIISVLVIGGVLTWGFLTNWGQVKKSEPVKYTVPVGIKKGSDTIEIDNPESLGFKIGQIIEIGNKETRTIVGFGSLILDRPLEYDYSENTIISVIDEPTKKDFKVDKCEIYNEDLTCQKCDDLHYLEDNICKVYKTKCGQDEWLDMRSGSVTSDRVCKDYTYTSNQNDCNHQISVFIPGTETSDQTCEKCTTNQWFANNECKDYTYSSETCNDDKTFRNGTTTTDSKCTCKDYSKWLGRGANNTFVCYDIIQNRGILDELIKYKKYDGEYKGKKYGPIKTWRFDKGIKDLSKLFDGNTNFNEDISGWDTSNVTNMEFMFHKCRKFNQNINTKVVNLENGRKYKAWDTSKVTNMRFMFRYAVNFNGDISGWDTTQVMDMSYMFADTTKFNQDIKTKVTREDGTKYKAWDTSKVTNMSYMFYKASNFNINILNWNVSNVTNMDGMFYKASNFNINISNWNVNDTAVNNATKNVNSSFYIFYNTLMNKHNCNKPTKLQTPTCQK